MLTVQDLINLDHLQLNVVGGLAATSRVITWAHTVDLPDPWLWVSPGDLVMTTGVGIPCGAQDQVSWLEQLVQSNASALVVAPRHDAPALSGEMLEAADRLLFPVLLASFKLEFVKLSHHVIESFLQAQRERFNASERLFQTYSEALRQSPDMNGRLAILAQAMGLGLAIEDTGSGVIMVDTRPCQARDPQHSERIPIGGRSQANLILVRKGKPAQEDALLVRSLVGLLGVELERLMIQRDAQREEGGQLLRSLLDSEIQLSLALPLLERRGLVGTLVSLAIQPGRNGSRTVDDVHHAPGLHIGTPLLMSDKDLLLAISVDDPQLLEALRLSLGAGTLIGVSSPIAAATGIQESARQARLALTQASEAGASVLRYGEAETGLIMAPKTLSEARALVGR